MIKWEVGMTLWVVPIRYWDEAENPEKVRLAQEIKEASYEYHLYVFHYEYGHEVYVPAERCYQSRDAAIKAGKLLTELYELKSKDESDWLVDRYLLKTKEAPQFSETKSIERECRGTTSRGWVVVPEHHVHPKSGNISWFNLRDPELIYRGHYEATKAKDSVENKSPHTIVMVEITPLFPIER